MKKNIMLALVLGLIPASLAAASPLAEIAPGRAQIDANVTLGSSLKGERDGHTIDFDGDTRYRVGATVGISDGLGLDYTYASHEGDDNASVQSHQVNLVYQFNPYLYGLVATSAIVPIIVAIRIIPMASRLVQQAVCPLARPRRGLSLALAIRLPNMKSVLAMPLRITGKPMFPIMTVSTRISAAIRT